MDPAYLFVAIYYAAVLTFSVGFTLWATPKLERFLSWLKKTPRA